MSFLNSVLKAFVGDKSKKDLKLLQPLVGKVRSFDKDMEKMAADEVTKEWWKHTKPCFEKFSFSENSEYYHDMKQIFHHK
jgi:L-rhamnose mutarotase